MGILGLKMSQILASEFISTINLKPILIYNISIIKKGSSSDVDLLGPVNRVAVQSQKAGFLKNVLAINPFHTYHTHTLLSVSVISVIPISVEP